MKDLVINKESERQVRDAFLKALPTQTDGITAVCLAQLTDLHPTAADKRRALDQLHDLLARILGEKALSWTIRHAAPSPSSPESLPKRSS